MAKVDTIRAAAIKGKEQKGKRGLEVRREREVGRESFKDSACVTSGWEGGRGCPFSRGSGFGEGVLGFMGKEELIPEGTNDYNYICVFV